MKKTLLVAAVAAVTALPALNMVASAQENLVFALVPKNMNNPFFDQARDGCKKAESELENVECLYIGPGEHGGGDAQFFHQEDIQIPGEKGAAAKSHDRHPGCHSTAIREPLD